MDIAILDNANARLITGSVPSYLLGITSDETSIAEAVIIALGLSLGETDYMIGNITTVLADHNADSSREARGIELLTQNFKEDSLEALSNLID